MVSKTKQATSINPFLGVAGSRPLKIDFVEVVRSKGVSKNRCAIVKFIIFSNKIE
jgi:hypothetical protein